MNTLTKQPGAKLSRVRQNILKTAVSLGLVLAMGGVIANLCSHKPFTPAKVEETAPIVRGELIVPTEASHATPMGRDEAPPPQKHRPKPTSFMRRMVEYQAIQAGGNDSNAVASFGGNPAAKIYTRAQLETPPEDRLPQGCDWLAFSTLSGFALEITPAMADGGKNPAVASALTLARIPDAVKQFDGRSVAIRGFLLPLKMDEGLCVEFLLMRDQNLCCFGGVPKVNEWIAVNAAGHGVKPVMDQPITVQGRLRVGEIRENGFLVGIYGMNAESIAGL